MSFPNINLPYLPPNTIVPPPSQDEITFLQYLTRLYEDIAININARDFTYFQIPISTTATNIPNLPRFGSFLICVSGVISTQPTGVWALCKSDATASGSSGIALLASQAGTGDWATFTLTVTSTTTNFQIAHNNTDPDLIVAGFNIRIVGSQL